MLGKLRGVHGGVFAVLPGVNYSSRRVREYRKMGASPGGNLPAKAGAELTTKAAAWIL